jgi:hypothetical protein
MIWSVLVGVMLVVVGVFLVSALFGAPYVPSRRAEVRAAFLKLKSLSDKDVLVDFGCGDGLVLEVAAEMGVGRAVGIELNPILGVIAKFKYRKNKKIQVRCGNMLSVKLPEDMSVAYIFGLDRVMRMLKPRLEAYAQEPKRDILVVSLAFECEGYEPVKRWGAYGLYRIQGSGD